MIHLKNRVIYQNLEKNRRQKKNFAPNVPTCTTLLLETGQVCLKLDKFARNLMVYRSIPKNRVNRSEKSGAVPPLFDMKLKPTYKCIWTSFSMTATREKGSTGQGQ